MTRGWKPQASSSRGFIVCVCLLNPVLQRHRTKGTPATMFTEPLLILAPPRLQPAGVAAPQAYLDAATAALSTIAFAPAVLPAAGPVAKAATAFAAAAAKQGALSVCPASCFNLGAFAAAAGAGSKCVCASAEQFAGATVAVGDTWKVRGPRKVWRSALACSAARGRDGPEPPVGRSAVLFLHSRRQSSPG